MTSDRLQAADAAAARGDLSAARLFLEQAILDSPDFESLLKLGSICRALADIPAAMSAVNAALSIRPLDFMALLSRAMLLEQMHDAGADEAFGRALAQKPDGTLPMQLTAIVDHAQTRFDAYVARRRQALATVMQPTLRQAAPEEIRRIKRFSSNTLRSTRPWHSEPTHYHFPGLIEREFHDRGLFPWLASLEAATETIAAECLAVMAQERAELVPYIQYGAHEPLDQWRELNHSPDWTAIHLLQNGNRVDANARHCPQTMALLDTLPQPKIAGCSPNAMFSLLAPDTIIPPHHGITNTRLVCHLPLIIPDGCWFRVGAETRQWQRGEAFVFDDTIEHEAANPSPDLRIVFIIDTWHPGLTATERDAVVALLEAEAGGLAL